MFKVLRKTAIAVFLLTTTMVLVSCGEGDSGETDTVQEASSQSNTNQGSTNQSTTNQANTTPDACRRFTPGHYIRVTDDGTRTPPLDGLARLTNVLNEDLQNFKGIVYQFMWGDLEVEEGVYDFTELDSVRELANASGMKYMFKMQDRTFWTSCSSNFVPNYIPTEGPRAGMNENFCVAKIWDEVVTTHQVRVLSAIADKYYEDPNFIGFAFEETAIAIDKANSGYSDEALVDELIRLSASLHENYPELILNQAVNWLPESQLNRLAAGLADLGGSGSFGWPDSVPANADNWHWYAIGVENNDKFVLMPSAQTRQIDADETSDVFDMLAYDMASHAVIWDIWHASIRNYLGAEIIPTVNAKNGEIINNTCPYE